MFIRRWFSRRCRRASRTEVGNARKSNHAPHCGAVGRSSPGELTSIDLLENALDRIATLDRKLESFVCLADDARAQAAAADREIAQGRWRGPLHGVPVAVKDNYPTADMPSRARTDAPRVAFARPDSAVVAQVRAACAVIA